MITDEQVESAALMYHKHKSLNVFSDNLHAMRKTLEAYEQSKWVKFDVNDESTYPTVPDGWVNVEVNVYDTVNNKVNHDYFHPEYGFNHFGRYVAYWQPLPQFKE